MPATNLGPAERSLSASLAAHALHSQGKTNTAPAQQAFHDRFRDEVDPNRVLPEAERERRAEHAFKAHMARLALRSAQARRKKAEQ